MLGIVDYGVGNLHSVKNALTARGLPFFMVTKPAELGLATKLILPGVGAFDDAMINLKKRCLASPLKRTIQSGIPTLGICLGMQLLCQGSEEGDEQGLGLFNVTVRKFPSSCEIVPHIGWNKVAFMPSNLTGLSNSTRHFYFVHSFYVPTCEHTLGISHYGVDFSAALHKDNIFGLQFHPEKSSHHGLDLLENFGGLL